MARHSFFPVYDKTYRNRGGCNALNAYLTVTSDGKMDTHVLKTKQKCEWKRPIAAAALSVCEPELPWAGAEQNTQRWFECSLPLRLQVNGCPSVVLRWLVLTLTLVYTHTHTRGWVCVCGSVRCVCVCLFRWGWWQRKYLGFLPDTYGAELRAACTERFE